MRPRKHILLYGGSEITQSILRLVLDSRGYAVETKLSTAPDAFLLIGFSEPEFMAFSAQRGQACRKSGVVCVPAGFRQQAGGMADLLDRVRMAVRKRRGPVRKEKPAELEIAA